MRRKYPKPLHNPGSDGFTLLEILIATAILAIALIAVFRLHYQSIALSEEIAFNATAPFLAEQVLSDLEGAGIDAAETAAGTFSRPPPVYAWQTDITEVALPVGEAEPPKLWRVDILVTSGERLKYQLTTYRRHEE